MKQIICLNNNKIYDTYTDASNDSGCWRTSISKCCNHKKHYTINKNNVKLFWLFKEEYDTLSDEQIHNIMNFSQYYYIKDYNKERMVKGE